MILWEKGGDIMGEYKKNQTICIQIDGETKEKLRVLAAAQQRSLAGQVRQLIRQFVREQEASRGEPPVRGRTGK